ncbi:galactocerebrosidase [Plakobranchus ocellatus]|uniref:galactosylceramidase n=1 Tax=Plakobranchus ocellatus TaxID=259542 RepID=A0AAV4BLN5_9GAST|nr:galactocerebrosidase [Plakobranchus ocellatus]
MEFQVVKRSKSFASFVPQLLGLYFIAFCNASIKDLNVDLQLHRGQKTLAVNDAISIIIDDTQGLGRRFEGIGALSGGGATSKLLVNYEKKLRDQILDYLFKPNFGASLQILKVEIGGDVQSTDGSEASHMHNSWDENYSRGYEWWIMKEAKQRNPDIKLYGLPWGFPGWLGQGTFSPYTNPEVTADYVIRWIHGAKTVHNLTIDYVGIWNEYKYNITYIKTLRKMLDLRGFEKTMVIGTDAYWGVIPDLIKDKSLADAIYAVGSHYPGTNSPLDAQKLGKPLWASEDYSTFNDEIGGGCWARLLNQNYVNGLLTATLSWNLIGSYYDHLPYFSSGLMTAAQPWSGHYNVSTPIWVSAHTTQFVSIGWKYFMHGSGVGKLPRGGSYVSLTNKAKNQLTIVIETMTHNHSKCVRPPLPPYEVSPQNITIVLKGSFTSISRLNVWYSKLGFDGAEDQMFQRKEPLEFENGQATVSLGLDEIFTLTTITSGNKGSYPKPPEPKPFPLPYSDNFEGHHVSEDPYNLTPQAGCFEIVKSQDASHGLVVRQTVLNAPIESCPWSLTFPIAIIGNYNWTDIAVEVDFEIPTVNGTKGVFVAARVDRGSCPTRSAQGIFFSVFPKTDKFVVSNDLAQTMILKQGHLEIDISTGWHKLSVTISGGKASGHIDSKKIFTVDMPRKPQNGWAAIGTDGFGYADFDNLRITNP